VFGEINLLSKELAFLCFCDTVNCHIECNEISSVLMFLLSLYMDSSPKPRVSSTLDFQESGTRCSE